MDGVVECSRWKTERQGDCESRFATRARFRRNRQLLIRAVGGERGGGRCRAQRAAQSYIAAAESGAVASSCSRFARDPTSADTGSRTCVSAVGHARVPSNTDARPWIGKNAALARRQVRFRPGIWAINPDRICGEASLGAVGNRSRCRDSPTTGSLARAARIARSQPRPPHGAVSADSSASGSVPVSSIR